MGFMGLLFKLAVECFNILAWPLFALVYPLCASIQAIETNSTSDTQKLITYWICFSLILLFDDAFEKLLEWLPYWPYIKLMIIGCLVTPHFNGSFYIYKHFVHCCLFMNPRIAFDWLIKLLDLLKQVNFLIEEKTQAKETVPEAKENLIAFEPKFEQPKVMQKGINAVKITEKNEVSATKQVRQIQPDFSLLGNATWDMVEIEEITAPNSMVGCGDPPGIPPLKKMQKEWSCAVCQVITRSEADLSSHLQGKQHEDACEKLKAKSQSSKSKLSSVETNKTQNKEIDKDHPVKEHFEKVSDKQKIEILKSNYEASTSVESYAALENKEIGSTSLAGAEGAQEEDIGASSQAHVKSGQSKQKKKKGHSKCHKYDCLCAMCVLKRRRRKHKENARVAKGQIGIVDSKPTQDLKQEVGCRDPLSIPPLKKIQKEWSCAVCHVITKSEVDLSSHLQGKQHKDACEKLKAKSKSSKSKLSSVETNIPRKKEIGAKGAKGEDVGASSQGHVKSGQSKQKKKMCRGKSHKYDCLCAMCVLKRCKRKYKENARVAKGQIGIIDSKPTQDLKQEVGSPLKKMQKEWSCAVCHVITRTEADHISHLQGKQHKDACEKLKAKSKFSKGKLSSVETDSPQKKELGKDHTDKEHSENASEKQKAKILKSDYVVLASVESHAALENKETGAEGARGKDVGASNQGHVKSGQSKRKKKRGRGKCHKYDCLCAMCVLKRCIRKLEVNARVASGQIGIIDSKPAQDLKQEVGCGDPHSISPLKKIQKEWSCAVCRVITKTEADLSSHLQGKQHKDACEKLKAKGKSSKSKLSSMETDKPQKKELGKDHTDKEHSENAREKQKAKILKSDYVVPASVESHAALENKETGAGGAQGEDVGGSSQGHVKSGQSKPKKKKGRRCHKYDCLCAMCVLKHCIREHEENIHLAESQIGIIDRKPAQDLKQEILEDLCI